MLIHERLIPQAVRVPLTAADKQAALNALVETIASVHGLANVEALKESVWSREQQRSTGMGEGLAIPHGRCDGIDELLIAVGRLAEPIEFDAIDRRPVRLIFLVISPTGATTSHIQALGKISRLMYKPELRRACSSADSSEELISLITTAENDANAS